MRNRSSKFQTATGHAPDRASALETSDSTARKRPWKGVLQAITKLTPIALGIAAWPAVAQQAAPVQQRANPPAAAVTVTVNPLSSAQPAQPVTVLEGNALRLRSASSLGETLNGLPGVSATGFAPGSSRPVIRGLDGDRIRILQNGVGITDASSLSFDHGVPVEPLSVERIEVLRGASAIQHGGSALGGVVNVVTNRIARSPVTGITGQLEAQVGGAGRGNVVAGGLQAGNGSFAVTADAARRREGDVRIPNFAQSAARRATTGDTANDRVPNSDSRSEGGALGVSFTHQRGYLGANAESYESNYGSPIERTVRIDLRSRRANLEGELNELSGPFHTVRLKAARTRYAHDELDAGVIGTRFRSTGQEGAVEALHAPLRFGEAVLTGALGVATHQQRFSALGAEAFVPVTNTRQQGAHVYEELAFGRYTLAFGLRGDKVRVSSDDGDPAILDASTGLARFGNGQSRRFSTANAALTGTVTLSPQWALRASYASNQRAPTYYELYANGPHLATGSYEIGDATFGKERSRAFDLGVQWKQGKHQMAVSAFSQRFRNYLAAFATGNTRGADGELNPVDADNDGVADGSGEDITNELQYRGVRARLTGIEFDAKWHLGAWRGDWFLLTRFDAVRGVDQNNNQALPRIAPTRVMLGVAYQMAAFDASLGLERHAAQSRVPAGDTTTAGYTLLNASASYRLTQGPVNLVAWLKGSNLTNKEARLATSFTRESVPLGGRAVSAGLRASF
jgi:iron complex outermembrane recepter protein